MTEVVACCFCVRAFIEATRRKQLFPVRSPGHGQVDLSYWRTEAGTEVDLIWHRGKRRLGFEIKYKDSWTSSDSAGLETLIESKMIERAFGIYRGPRRLVRGSVTVLPFMEALEGMRSGEIGFA